MTEVLSRFGLSARRFCRLTGWNRSSLQYQAQGRDDGALRERLRHWAALKPRWALPSFMTCFGPKASSSTASAPHASTVRKASPCVVNAAASCLRQLGYPSLSRKDLMIAGRCGLKP